MSQNHSQDPADSISSWSPFDTFELPTSNFVLELPPLIEDADVPPLVEAAAVADVQPVADVAAVTEAPVVADVQPVAEAAAVAEAPVVADVQPVAEASAAVEVATVAEAAADADEEFLEIDPVLVPPAPAVQKPARQDQRDPEAAVSIPKTDGNSGADTTSAQPVADRPVEATPTPPTVVKVPLAMTATGQKAEPKSDRERPIAASADAPKPAATLVAKQRDHLNPPSRPIAQPNVTAQPKPTGAGKASAEPTASAVSATEPSEPLFCDLPLSEEVQKAVQESGYDRPTAIQAQIIPHMLEGRDVLAQSQTGSGKTAAFALPILSRLNMDQRTPQILVLAPTRELAVQVADSFSKYGAHLAGFSVAAIYGGQDYQSQFRQLKQGVQVVVGTPGRVIDHINRGTLDLSDLKCLALDEADEMLNMGFLDDVQFVLDHTPEGRQVALFSATLPPPIRHIADRYLTDPVRITIKQKTMTAESIRQRALFVAPRDKVDVLVRFLEVEETDGVIVFTKTKDATVTVAEQLCQQGLSAVALNGDMPQKLRERTIQQLKGGHLDILVATDVAARGLDVTRVSHVFNFDVPHDSESYVHRIGRTGRAGRKGEAIIFLTNSQRHKLRVIERATRQTIEVVQVPTADEINMFRMRQFEKKIADTIESQDVTVFERLIRKYATESGQPLEQIAAALAHLGQAGRPFLMTERPGRRKFEDRPQRDHDRGSDRAERHGSGFADRGARGRTDFRQLGSPERGMDRYRIEVGRKDGVKPGNIVGAVANEGGIDGNNIGPIRIHESHSTIDLPEGMPADIFQTLQQTVVAGRQLRLSKEPTSGHQSSDQRPRGFTRDKGAHPGKHRKRNFGSKHKRSSP